MSFCSEIEKRRKSLRRFLGDARRDHKRNSGFKSNDDLEKFVDHADGDVVAVRKVEKKNFAPKNSVRFVFVRPVCGIYQETLLINFPGSKKGSVVS